MSPENRNAFFHFVVLKRKRKRRQFLPHLAKLFASLRDLCSDLPKIKNPCVKPEARSQKRKLNLVTVLSLLVFKIRVAKVAVKIS